jgi:hypothetical protein
MTHNEPLTPPTRPQPPPPPPGSPSAAQSPQPTPPRSGPAPSGPQPAPPGPRPAPPGPRPAPYPGAPAGRAAVDSQAVASRQGCGCSRGCLTVLLTLALLLVGGVVAALTFGRGYVARRLPTWEAQQPLLGPALDLTGLRAKLQPRSEVDVYAQKRARQGGVDDRALLPADLALYARPAHEAYNIGATQVTAYQRVSATRDEAHAHVLDGMAAHGWELLQELETPEGLQLAWRKGERTCQIALVAVDGQVELWLRAVP